MVLSHVDKYELEAKGAEKLLKRSTSHALTELVLACLGADQGTE